jgi:hypothetical protein
LGIRFLLSMRQDTPSVSCRALLGWAKWRHPFPYVGSQTGKVRLMWKFCCRGSHVYVGGGTGGERFQYIDSRASWRCKHDGATRGFSEAITALVDSPSKDGQARRFDVSWSPYGGERCSTPLGSDTTSTYFTYDVWWYITDLSHVNNLSLTSTRCRPTARPSSLARSAPSAWGDGNTPQSAEEGALEHVESGPAAAESGRPTAGTI